MRGAVLALALALAAAPAAGGVCEEAAAEASRRHGVPEALMRALLRVESGARPWAMNVEGRGRFPPSRAAAAAEARRLAARGASFDLGCFQINHRWHGKAFPSVEAMLDPTKNADYAARFLASLHAEANDWMVAAGHYHSRTPALATRYRARVRAALGDRRVLDAPAPVHAEVASAVEHAPAPRPREDRAPSRPAAGAAPVTVVPTGAPAALGTIAWGGPRAKGPLF